MSRVKFSWCQVEHGRREGEGEDHFTGSFQETGQNLEHSREKAQEEEQEGKKIALVLEMGSWCPESRCVEMSMGPLETLGGALSREGGRR